MSDDQKPEASAEGTPPADEIKNVKAEMNRKLSNFEQVNAELKAKLDAILGALPKPEPKAEKKVSVFEDEDKFAESIIEKATKVVETKLTAAQQAQSRTQAVINSMHAEFPEISQPGSELYKRAIEIHASLPEDEKSSPAAIRAAIAQAAIDTGTQPLSKRTKSADSFSMGSKSGGKSRSESEDKLDPRTEAFAKAVGANLEGVKARAKRKEYGKWGRYE